jgi:HEAT repeat protein
MDSRLSNGLRKNFFTRACPRIVRSALAVTCGLILSLAASAAQVGKLDAETSSKLQAITNAQLQICLPAIEALGRSNNPAVIKPLADAFALENRPVVRRSIIDALGSLRSRSAIPTLKQALNDPDVQIRQSAVAAVGLLAASDEQAILLEHAAGEKNPLIKRQMVHHLGLLQTPEAKNALKAFSKDSDASVRDMAARRLNKEPNNKP